MAVRRILGMASLASMAILAGPAPARPGSGIAGAVQERPAADLVVRGRIVEETARSLPETPGWVVLASVWTYRIHVVRVIRGHERSEEIVATNDADPELRRDVDFVFDLSRGPDGAYRVVKLKRA